MFNTFIAVFYWMEGELDKASSVQKFRTVKIEGERTLLHHNLDMLISLFHGTRLNKLFINHELVFAELRPDGVWDGD